MTTRRRLLATAAAAGALPAFAAARAQAPAKAAAGSGADARAQALMTRIGDEAVDSAPELATSLGLDKGARAGLKAKLSDRSAAALARAKAANTARLKALRAVDQAQLTGQTAISFEGVTFQAEAAEAAAKFPYGDWNFTDAVNYPLQPYTLSQLTGTYQPLPDFMDSQHSIAAKADADAYISRLAAAGAVLDQETARAKADGARGVIPPRFILERALGQMKTLRDTPAAKATLVQSVARRAKAAGVAGDYEGQATRLYETSFKPALDRQIALLTSWLPKSTAEAGVRRLPDGEAYYAACLKLQTTTTLSADEIHTLGREQSKAILARMDAILKAQGMSQGTVGARMAALGRDPKFLYPNTEEGKAKLLSDLNKQVTDMRAKLPEVLGTLPKSAMEVKRVPAAIEAGAPGGYAMFPPLDGSRPGAYYINLRDTAEWPTFTLPTLTYHEAVPGHLVQGSLAVENQALPLIGKILGFSAYTEGWGLYAEQLADEMGVYAQDPWGQLGYLQSLLFRASRLVVDTGLHSKGWSREQGIDYMVDTGGDDRGSITTEVERYCVWPGQACSYKVGHTVWERSREQARQAMGAKFDIRAFHDLTLLPGATPLTVLERRVAAWAKAA